MSLKSAMLTSNLKLATVLKTTEAVFFFCNAYRLKSLIKRRRAGVDILFNSKTKT